VNAVAVVGCCALVMVCLAVWVLAAAALATWCGRHDDDGGGP
jgi:hypothetical protein